MKEEQVNITSDYHGDFTEITGTPTINGKRMGIFEKKRFNYWKERNHTMTQSHDDYLMGGGKCYGGNIGDTVSFELLVHARQDGKEQEIRIRKLLMTCKNKQGDITFEMLFGGFDYDNHLDDFFADFMESPYYLVKKQ